MLAILFVIVGIFGVFLNWPIIESGIFRSLTGVSGNNIHTILAIIKEFSQGFSRPDGIAVIVVSVIVVFSIFLHTTNIMIGIRSFLLAFISLMLIGELFTALSKGYPLYSYTGLLYTCFFFIIAFFASVLKIGSKKSLNSTIQGTPMTESQAFTQGIRETIDAAASVIKISLTALDDISSDWLSGQVKVFEKPRINIGRDPSWANLKIGSKWNTVSRQHGTLSSIGGSVFYNQVSRKYSFAVNDTPYQNSTDIPDGSIISLVSGYGPKFKINYTQKRLPVAHPKTLSKTTQIAVDEFKKLQSTIKAFVIIAFLSIPIFGFFTVLQTSTWKGAVAEVYKEKKKVESKLKVVNSKLLKKKRVVEKLSRKLDKINNEIKKKEEELKKLESAIEEKDKEITALEREKEEALKRAEEVEKKSSSEIEKIRREKEEAIKKAEMEKKRYKAELEKKKEELEKQKREIENSSDIKNILEEQKNVLASVDELYLSQKVPVVFPILMTSKSLISKKGGSFCAGTGFIAKDSSGNLYIFSARHVVYDLENGEKAIAFLGFDRKYARNPESFKDKLDEMISSGKLSKKSLKSISKELVKENILFTTSELWSYVDVSSMSDCTAYIKMPSSGNERGLERLKEIIPTISKDIKKGDIFGIIGYPSNVRSHTVGLVSSVNEYYFEGFIQAFHGFSGGPALKIETKGNDDVIIRVIGVTSAIAISSSHREKSTETKSIYFKFPSNF